MDEFTRRLLMFIRYQLQVCCIESWDLGLEVAPKSNMSHCLLDDKYIPAMTSTSQPPAMFDDQIPCLMIKFPTMSYKSQPHIFLVQNVENPKFDADITDIPIVSRGIPQPSGGEKNRGPSTDIAGR